jgi:hypothetical protein
MFCASPCYYDKNGKCVSKIIWCGYDVKEIEFFGKVDYSEWNY